MNVNKNTKPTQIKFCVRIQFVFVAQGKEEGEIEIFHFDKIIKRRLYKNN